MSINLFNDLAGGEPTPGGIESYWTIVINPEAFLLLIISSVTLVEAVASTVVILLAIIVTKLLNEEIAKDEIPYEKLP